MRRRVAVVGAGPGGLAAARRLKEVANDAVEVVLFEHGPSVEYLPATVRVFLGQGPRKRWSAPLRPPGVKVRVGAVGAVRGTGVTLDGETVAADAVICAPGLALDHDRLPKTPNVYSFWDPAGAERAAPAARDTAGKTVAVVVSSLPYRCPPAPYGMAMELAFRNRATRVILSTPEPAPLSVVGGGAPEFLETSCDRAGVELLTNFVPDLSVLGEELLRSDDGREVNCDRAFVVPPHARHPLLAGLPGGGPLVPVSRRFESADPGLFVVGDAAMTPLPRASDVAVAGGMTAADAALEGLGLAAGAEPHKPRPECFIGHGGGRYSRISLSYPEELPPDGTADVRIEGPSEDLAAGFEASFERWRDLRAG